MSSHHLMAVVVTAFLFAIIVVPQVSSDNEINEHDLFYSRSESRSHRDAVDENNLFYIKSKDSDNSGKPHDLILGQVGYNDKIYYSDVVSANRVRSEVVSENVFYTLNPTDEGQIRQTNGDIISFIEVHSIGPIERAGYPTVIDGGVGHENVTINFTSQRGHGYYFIVMIFGKNPNNI